MNTTSTDAHARTLPAGRLYFGTVTHARFRPVEHSFRYKVFSMLIDVDRINELDRSTRFFSYNKRNIFSFFDRDHGRRDGTSLRSWILSVLSQCNLDFEPNHIELLCYPRLWGYVFNPLSVFYCYDSRGVLIACVYEVSNTFGESHAYVIPAAHAADNGNRQHHQSAQKIFYVSPFLDVKGQYNFNIDQPDDTVAVLIRETQDGELVLLATFGGRAKPFSDSVLLHALGKFPLMTLKVIAAIHWEAFALWRKGIKHIPHTDHRSAQTSLGKSLD